MPIILAAKFKKHFNAQPRNRELQFVKPAVLKISVLKNLYFFN